MQARDKDAIEFLDKVTYDNVLHKEEWIRNYEKQHKILEMHKGTSIFTSIKVFIV